MKKDTRKSSVVWARIDLALLAVLLVLVGLFLSFVIREKKIGDLEYEATMDGLRQTEASIASRKEQKLQEHAAAAESARQLYGEAKAELEAQQEHFRAANTRLTELQEQRDALQAELDDIASLQEQIVQLRTDYGEACRRLEDKILAGESEYRIVYLTFDDGPSYYTPRFLKKLADLHVHATFFTIGVEMPSKDYGLRDQYLREEAMGGHIIANHTYTHAYSGKLYRSLDNFMDAVRRQDDLVYQVTGFHTSIVRFPAGSHYCSFRKSAIAQLEKEGFCFIDWAGNAFDSGGPPYRNISGNVIWQARQRPILVVLMHDWNLDTLAALDRIVTTLREENTIFLPLFPQSCTMGEATVPLWD